ncbi:MAG: ABC transporter substrate-binding protein, partial [Pseudomonadota bacterium]|nr:ABC transporter substrate-binding protein [Pseudomonadota bacterium]
MVNSLKEKDFIHIAFVGPMIGNGDAAGILMSRAIQLYLDTINKKGGVNGKKIILDIYNDQNDPEQARQKALDIVAQKQAVAVIGHWYSSTSISAGSIYKKYGIPAITPGSTNIKVTADNEWYFRNIFNAQASGKFLAHYIKKVLQYDKVSLIYETGAYGDYLAQVFTEEAQKLELTLQNQWRLNTQQAAESNFEYIIEQLKQNQAEAGMLFLAVQASDGVKLVKHIKEAGIKNPIIGESSFSEKTFVEGFKALPKEQAAPGYYTNDIYVATPLLFDTANDKAQLFRQAYRNRYQEEPDWSAAYAYDTAMIIVEAIRKMEVQGDAATIVADRQKIRDFMAQLNTAQLALEGVTGLNYFNSQGDAQKPVSIGIYKNNNLISALTQLQLIGNINEIGDLEGALQAGRVLKVDNKYLYKTNVVYTGIEVNKISDLNLKDLTYQLDFHLWFRFRGAVDTNDIEFINAVDAVQLSAPLIETKNRMTYHSYQVQGRFLADFLLSHYTYKQHTLGVSFRHRQLSRNHLIYVTDVLGMGLNDQRALLERWQNQQVLASTFDWNINQVWFFQDIIKKSALGGFKYLNMQEKMIRFSRFNMGIKIQKNELAIRGTLPYSWANKLLILSGIMMLILILLVKSYPQHFQKTLWFFQSMLAILVLLASEVILINWLLDKTLYEPSLVTTTFDVFWWIIPAVFVNIAIKRFIWRPLQERTGRSVPNVIRFFV